MVGLLLDGLNLFKFAVNNKKRKLRQSVFDSHCHQWQWFSVNSSHSTSHLVVVLFFPCLSSPAVRHQHGLLHSEGSILSVPPYWELYWDVSAEWKPQTITHFFSAANSRSHAQFNTEKIQGCFLSPTLLFLMLSPFRTPFISLCPP